MVKARKLLEKVAKKLDFPTDVAVGLPRLSMNGFSEITLDRHRGIAEYERDRIVVRLTIGLVTIQGEELEVRLMHREALTVCGKITGLLFDER